MGGEEFESDFVVVSDEEGNEIELEIIMAFDVDGESYMSFLPADMDEDDPDYGYVILKIVEENGEEIFVTVDDDAELEKAYDTFIELIVNEEEGE